MRAEIICVGTELLTGKVNTNISYISEILLSIGISIERATTLPDDMDALVSGFKESIKRADLIIISGGLGPTFDDLTREAISKVLKKKLILNKEILQNIVRHFIERNIEMPESNKVQAYIIENAKPIYNTVGTAPGQIIETTFESSKKIIILLPGPPREIKPMFENDILPYLKNKVEKKIIKIKTLHIYGLPESVVDTTIRPVIDKERQLKGLNLSFTILAHRSIIDIKISVGGKDELIIDEFINNIKREIYQLFKDNIYGEDNDTLESVLGKVLTENKKTISVAESCTGGLISNRITNISGSSVYFKQGIVAYSNATKIKLLGVLPEIIDKYGAVSKETAYSMAEGMRKISLSDFGLSVTGIAGPGGGTEKKPVGLVYFGFSSEKETITEEKIFSGNRTEIKELSANYALYFALKNIKKK